MSALQTGTQTRLELGWRLAGHSPQGNRQLATETHVYSSTVGVELGAMPDQIGQSIIDKQPCQEYPGKRLQDAPDQRSNGAQCG